jgi:gentisate 1,2-dioxygenase
MERGDLIVTPAGTWHDHGNEGSEPVMWVDVLDLPLVENMSASVFDNDYFEAAATGPEPGAKVRRANQSVTHPAGYSTMFYGAGGLVPAFGEHVRGDSAGTPMFIYRWKDAKEALNRLRHLPGSPHDGIILEYVNPIDGGPVTTTMGFTVQLLRPGEKTKAHRQRSSAAYCCLEGHGETIVGGTVLKWGPNDLFVVPSWAPHSHINASKSEDAVLYAVTDVPALKKLGLYQEEDVV